MFYLDAVVNIDLSIKHAQDTMWKALKGVPEFNISMEETQNVLESYAKSKGTLVILHIDLVSILKAIFETAGIGYIIIFGIQSAGPSFVFQKHLPSGIFIINYIKQGFRKTENRGKIQT